MLEVLGLDFRRVPVGQEVPADPVVREKDFQMVPVELEDLEEANLEVAILLGSCHRVQVVLGVLLVEVLDQTLPVAGNDCALQNMGKGFDPDRVDIDDPSGSLLEVVALLQVMVLLLLDILRRGLA